MKETVRRYALSTLITFLAAFGVVLLADIDRITIESFRDGTILGILFAGARAGLKAVIEAFLVSRQPQ